jgi:hypothetical protein
VCRLWNMQVLIVKAIYYVRVTLPSEVSDKNVLVSYRPISHLSYLSKLTECIQCILIFCLQATFSTHCSQPKPYSNLRALQSLLSTIMTSEIVAKVRLTCLFLLDFSAAFNATDHSIRR